MSFRSVRSIAQRFMQSPAVTERQRPQTPTRDGNRWSLPQEQWDLVNETEEGEEEEEIALNERFALGDKPFRHSLCALYVESCFKIKGCFHCNSCTICTYKYMRSQTLQEYYLKVYKSKYSNKFGVMFS